MKKTLKKKITKNLKPTEIDAHIRYVCPDIDCGFDHWISLRESQTKNFIIVCDCGLKIRPKTVKTIKIIYKKQIVKQKPKELPVDTLKKCLKIMFDFGFVESEAEPLLIKAYTEHEIDDHMELVKKAIASIGVENDKN